MSGRGSRNGKYNNNHRNRGNPKRDDEEEENDDDDDEEEEGAFLLFRLGGIEKQFHRYNKVRDQLEREVVDMIEFYGIDIIDMLHQDREVDVAALEPKRPPTVMKVSAGGDNDDDDDDTAPATTKVEDNEDQEYMTTAEEIEYKIMFEHWVARKIAYRQNKSPLCTQIRQRCHQDLIDRLERSCSDYHEFSRDDPLRLLDAIKMECIKEREYPMAVQVRVMQQTFNLYQWEDESVHEYAIRAKRQWELFFHTVDIRSTHFIQQSMQDIESKTKSTPSEQPQEEINNDDAKQRMMAYMLLAHADPQRFGEKCMGNIKLHYILGKNLYPKTFHHAWDILSSLEYIATTAASTDNDDDDDDDAVDTDEVELTYDNLQGRCHVCGKKGHYSVRCHQKNSLPKCDWFLEKVKRNERSRNNST
jgi:hypothetical protein